MNKINYPFCVLALDIGGTKIAGGILKYDKEDLAPTIVYKTKINAQAKKGADVFVNNICKCAKELKRYASIKLDTTNCPIISIGMGCAGRINKHTGKIITATDNFPGFKNTELTNVVNKAVDLPAYALNDVQSHTYGEWRWGAGKNVDNFVLLAIGTGIGGAVVVNGKLLMGEHGYAGELGHIDVCMAKDIKCSCGKKGHLESVASGTGIEDTYFRKTGKKISGSQISNLANNGDKNAKYAIQLAGESLGHIIATYLSIFDPKRIILGGSVIKSGDLWKKALEKGYNDEIIDDIRSNLNLVDAKLGDDAALIGAAEYSLDNLLQNK